MDDSRFDALIRAFGRGGSRRTLLKGLLGLGGLVAAGSTLDDTEAARRGYPGPPTPVPPNLGSGACVGVGQICNALVKCCSGYSCGSNGTCSCNGTGGYCQSDGDCCGSNYCSGGACVASQPGGSCTSSADCTRGLTCCAGTCVDLQNDVNNCGVCDLQCLFPSGTPYCNGGTCDTDCSSQGYVHCVGEFGPMCCQNKCCQGCCGPTNSYGYCC